MGRIKSSVRPHFLFFYLSALSPPLKGRQIIPNRSPSPTHPQTFRQSSLKTCDIDGNVRKRLLPMHDLGALFCCVVIAKCCLYVFLNLDIVAKFLKKLQQHEWPWFFSYLTYLKEVNKHYEDYTKKLECELFNLKCIITLT